MTLDSNSLAQFGFEFLRSLGEQAVEAGVHLNATPEEEPAPPRPTPRRARHSRWEPPPFLDPEEHRVRRAPEDRWADAIGEIAARLDRLETSAVRRTRDRRDVGPPSSRRPERTPVSPRPSPATTELVNTPAVQSEESEANHLGTPTPLGGTFETTAVPAATPRAASGTDAERIDTPTSTPAFDEEALERRIVAAVSDRLMELLAPVLGLAERMEALEQKIETIDTERERPSADTQALALRVEALERQLESRPEEDPSSPVEQPTAPTVELHPKLVAELRLAQTMLVAFFLMMDGEHDNIEPIARHLSTWIEKAQPIVPEIVARFGPAAALEPQCTGPPGSDHPRESDA